jgi:hypothetical protein
VTRLDSRVIGVTAAPVRQLASTDVASAIYGSMLVTVLLAAQSRADVSVPRVGLYVILGVFAFWLTHIWATLVGMRIQGPVTRTVVTEVAREESPMLASAALPLLALAAGVLGTIASDQALDFALAVAVGQLFVWGVAVGRATGRAWGSAVLVGLVDLALGLAIVSLKVFVLH